MKASAIKKAFRAYEPILREELEYVLKISNEHSFNQALSYLVAFGIIRRYENGIYYLPGSEDKEPTLADILDKKYLKDHQGIRVGDHLLYKYGFSQTPSDLYEIQTNQVAPSTRAKKEYDGQASVSYPKCPINKENQIYLEFLELVKMVERQDIDFDQCIARIVQIFYDLSLDMVRLQTYSQYYKGNRHARFHKCLEALYATLEKPQHVH